MEENLHQILSMLPFVIPLFFLEMGLLAFALVDLIQRKKVRGDNKVVWIIVIVVFQVFGPIIYFMFGRKEEIVDSPLSTAASANLSPVVSILLPREKKKSGPAIKTEDLSKYYGNIQAVDKLNLEIPENVVFGFLGPNGAGKTTTVKLLTGFALPTAGKARVAGEAVGSNCLALQAKIGLLPGVYATGR